MTIEQAATLDAAHKMVDAISALRTARRKLRTAGHTDMADDVTRLLGCLDVFSQAAAKRAGA